MSETPSNEPNRPTHELKAPAQRGMLTHDQMKAVLAGGGVIQMADGRTIFRHEDLPTPAELANASGDPAQVAQTEADIDAEIERLKGQKATLKAAPKPEAEPEPEGRDTPPAEKPKVEPLPLPEPKKRS